MSAASAESTPFPSIHTALPGETYPINLGGGLKSTSELAGEGGGILKATEFSLLLIASALISLGAATIELLGLGNSEGQKCHTEGDSEAAGAVLLPGAEYQLVYSSLSPPNALELAGLLSFTKFTLFCDAGTFENTFTGPLTSRLSVPESGAGTEGDSTDIELGIHCGSRTTALQEIPYYYGDNLEEIPTTLLTNPAGTGKKKACWEIEGTNLTRSRDRKLSDHV